MRARVPVEHASLYLELRGRCPGAPVLVWLHGGPGAAERPLFRWFDGDLEASYLVAYYDQRGAGKSFDPGADPARLTIAQHLRDLDVIVDRLRASTGSKKVVLVGHSWGSALGLLYAQRRPDKVAAFVGVAQFTSELARQHSQREFVLARAQESGDQSAASKANALGPPPWNADQELRMQRLVERFGGYAAHPPSKILTSVELILNGLVSVGDVPRFIRANELSLHAMQPELLGLDLRKSVPGVEVPVAFFLGRTDRQLDSRLAAAYFSSLRAPEKRLVWFDAGHDIPFERPAAFQHSLIRALAELGIAGSAHRSGCNSVGRVG